MVVNTVALPNVPVPLVVHIPPVAPVTDAPTRLNAPALAQVVWFAPALTTGPWMMVTTKLSNTALQFPLAVLVKVKVAVPAAISAALGL